MLVILLIYKSIDLMQYLPRDIIKNNNNNKNDSIYTQIHLNKN